MLPLTLIAGLSAPAAPALASNDAEVVKLSSDGITYSRSLDTLFGPVTLAPMDRVNTQFWVQNAGADPAYLTIMVLDTEIQDPELAANLSLKAGPSGTAAKALPLPSSGSCTTLNVGTVVGANQEIPIDSALALGDLNGTQGQGASIRFTLRVMLSDQPLTSVGSHECSAVPGEGQPDGMGGSSTGSGNNATSITGQLGTTGAEMRRILLLGAVLLVLGFAIVALKRRRPGNE